MEDQVQLPLDVWSEVLQRIPAVNLLRLKAVCRTWRQLISDGSFTLLHLNHKPVRSIIISSRFPLPCHYSYDPDDKTLSDWYDERRSDVPDYEVMDSYHGLLLVVIGSFRPYKKNTFLAICNPLTKSHNINLTPAGFLFEDLWKIVYDASSKLYKVLGIKRLSKVSSTVGLYVFDVGRDREGDPPGPRETAIKTDVPMEHVAARVLVKGSVYWLLTGRVPLQDEEVRTCNTTIVSANIATEELKARKCSPLLDIYQDTCSNFFASNQTFYFCRGLSPSQLQLWLLKGVESENPNPNWMNQHLLETTTSNLNFSCRWRTKVFGFCRDKLILTCTKTKRVYRYDLSRKELEEVTVAASRRVSLFAPYLSAICFSTIIEHIDSLVSLEPNKELAYKL